MISATHYPYSDEKCTDLHNIVCVAIRDSQIKFTPLAYAIFYQAAMNGFTCALSDELLAIDKGKELEFALSGLYRKYIGDSFIEEIGLLDDISEKLREGADQLFTNLTQSGLAINQQIDRLDSASLTQMQLSSIAGFLKKEAASMAFSQYVFIENISEAQIQISELKRKLAELQNLVATDPVTTVASRFAYDSFIKQTLPTKQPLSLVIADIDHFNALNEHFSDHIGDAILRYIAKKLKSMLSEKDFIARWESDALIMVLVNQSPAEVMHQVEQMRLAITNAKISIKSSKQEIGKVSLSFGIAHANELDTEETLQQRADQAMRLSKENGRNRLTLLD